MPLKLWHTEAELMLAVSAAQPETRTPTQCNALEMLRSAPLSAVTAVQRSAAPVLPLSPAWPTVIMGGSKINDSDNFCATFCSSLCFLLQVAAAAAAAAEEASALTFHMAALRNNLNFWLLVSERCPPGVPHCPSSCVLRPSAFAQNSCKFATSGKTFGQLSFFLPLFLLFLPAAGWPAHPLQWSVAIDWHSQWTPLSSIWSQTFVSAFMSGFWRTLLMTCQRLMTRPFLICQPESWPNGQPLSPCPRPGTAALSLTSAKYWLSSTLNIFKSCSCIKFED